MSITFRNSLSRNESTSACQMCTARCCSHIPGSVFPAQLEEITANNILKLLHNGYCVDWWENDPRPNKDELSRAYYLRPSMKGFEHRVKDPSYGGYDCVFLTPAGCKHEFENRPLECQGLIPNENHPGNCVGTLKISKRDSAIAWIPYQSFIEQAIELFEQMRN